LDVAARAQVKRLVLIHHSPVKSLGYSADIEAIRPNSMEVEISHDGMQLEF
jgi:ribonuclease BN (tRNA processing enzyme)